LNGTHQLLVYADYVNVSPKHRHHKEKYIQDSKVVGLEVNR